MVYGRVQLALSHGATQLSKILFSPLTYFGSPAKNQCVINVRSISGLPAASLAYMSTLLPAPRRLDQSSLVRGLETEEQESSIFRLLFWVVQLLCVPASSQELQGPRARLQGAS